MKKFYISTPIYYSSGHPHIGHAYTTILADVMNEYKKLLGYETFFITGMDEHGQKIENISKKENVSCKDLVDKNSKIFKKLWHELDIYYNVFMRTTDDNHKNFVQEKFSYLYSKNYIYLDKWESNYCLQCEEDIIDKKIKINNEKKYCEHGHELTIRSEESYFLKMKNLKEWINDIFDKNVIDIIPNNRVLELKNNFLNQDFRDLSISRKNMNWGIDIKESDDHKIYVWLDALLNYLSGLKIHSEKSLDYFWNDPETEIVHLLSKEITRFHCIYWPMILKMMNYRLPSKIISHGWIETKEGKMSKSLGNVVDPFELIKKYGSDSTRYFLLKNNPISNDSIFSEDLLILTHNSDLCNNFGNIINRTIGLIKKYNNNYIPDFVRLENKLMNSFEKDILYFVNQIKDLSNNLEVNMLIKEIINFENKINLFIDESKPWELQKENKNEIIKSFLSLLSNAVKTLIFFISPILKKASPLAWEAMNFSNDIFNIEDMTNFSNIKNIKINSSIILFNRIEKNEN